MESLPQWFSIVLFFRFERKVYKGAPILKQREKMEGEPINMEKIKGKNRRGKGDKTKGQN